MKLAMRRIATCLSRSSSAAGAHRRACQSSGGLFAEQIQGCGFEGEDFKTDWEPFSDRGSAECVDVDFRNGKKSVRLHVEGGRAGIRQGRLFVDAGHAFNGSL